MSENKHSILESWPALKEDLMALLSDTDAWIVAELEKAHKEKDWDRLGKVIQIMESIHTLSHQS